MVDGDEMRSVGLHQLGEFIVGISAPGMLPSNTNADQRQLALLNQLLRLAPARFNLHFSASSLNESLLGCVWHELPKFFSVNFPFPDVRPHLPPTRRPSTTAHNIS